MEEKRVTLCMNSDELGRFTRALQLHYPLFHSSHFLFISAVHKLSIKTFGYPGPDG